MKKEKGSHDILVKWQFFFDFLFFTFSLISTEQRIEQKGNNTTYVFEFVLCVSIPGPKCVRYTCRMETVRHTDSRSTFEFPSRINLSGPRFYCIARTLGKGSRHSIGLAGETRLTWSDFWLNLLLLKGQGCVDNTSVFHFFRLNSTLYCY